MSKHFWGDSVQLFILLLFCISALSIIFYSFFLGITPNATHLKVKALILKNLPPVDSGTVIEAGSGWGGLAIGLALALPQCSVVGYELSPLPWGWSKLRKKVKGIFNLQFRRQNFYNVSFQDCSLVVCYLFPKAMERLKDKFLKELSPGAIVISHTFSIPGWKATQVIEAGDLYNTQIFIYRKET